MKKIFILLALAIALFSCDNDEDTWTGPIEQNPYPDGVYPFEVSNISHTEEELNTSGRKFIFTWDNPNDKGFSRVRAEAFLIIQSDGKGYPLAENAIGTWSFVLEKSRLTMTNNMGNDQYLIIKCVDRFGNISEGEKYNYYKYVNPDS